MVLNGVLMGFRDDPFPLSVSREMAACGICKSEVERAGEIDSKAWIDHSLWWWAWSVLPLSLSLSLSLFLSTFSLCALSLTDDYDDSNNDNK